MARKHRSDRRRGRLHRAACLRDLHDDGAAEALQEEWEAIALPNKIDDNPDEPDPVPTTNVFARAIETYQEPKDDIPGKPSRLVVRTNWKGTPRFFVPRNPAERVALLCELDAQLAGGIVDLGLASGDIEQIKHAWKVYVSHADEVFQRLIDFLMQAPAKNGDVYLHERLEFSTALRLQERLGVMTLRELAGHSKAEIQAAIGHAPGVFRKIAYAIHCAGLYISEKRSELGRRKGCEQSR